MKILFVKLSDANRHKLKHVVLSDIDPVDGAEADIVVVSAQGVMRVLKNITGIYPYGDDKTILAANEFGTWLSIQQ